MAIVEVDEEDRFELINPEIIESSGESVDVEGCLSIPHTYGTVKRADEITVRYFDREGEKWRFKLLATWLRLSSMRLII